MNGAGDEFVLVGASPCDVAFHAAEVLRIGRAEDFPGLELVDLSTALGMGPRGDALAATLCDTAGAEAAERTVLLVARGDHRMGIVVSGRISLIAAGQLQSLSVPALLRTHESIVGLLAKSEAPTAVVVSVPRLFTARKGSP